MELSKNTKVLYIDSFESDQFIIGEMIRNNFSLLSADNETSALDIISRYINSISVVIMSVDNIDHSRIVNEYYARNKQLPKLILITQSLDLLKMFNLVNMYAACDFLVKPFTKIGLVNSITEVLSSRSFQYLERLECDLNLFNIFIDQYNVKCGKSVAPFILEPLDVQINRLTELKESIEENFELPKSIRPKILFIDDEKDIIAAYREFVENKPFSPFFLII